MSINCLIQIKYAGVCLTTLCLVCLAGCAANSADTSLHRMYFRYVASLDQRLRILFIETRAIYIVVSQLLISLLIICFSLLLNLPLGVALLPLVAFAPRWILEQKRKDRVLQIEQKLDGFVVALANALRAAPSPGRALAMVQPITAGPLRHEIELVLREMRVGSTLEQALGNLSARVRSFQLDAAMSGLLIGCQTGGNVPDILDSAAHTMREMARLQGVLRSKTAEGRAQTNVLAVFPVLLIVSFDFVSPGYFRPLTESVSGVMVMSLAIGMWLLSIFLTRRILAVEL